MKLNITFNIIFECSYYIKKNKDSLYTPDKSNSVYKSHNKQIYTGRNKNKYNERDQFKTEQKCITRN